ncbi:hypothetical protein Tsubulata_048076 [Turnera subulata]|uniref:Fatty acid desaturase domain-containing protein n=1 Tax=Turnera subulata TaxID=218843 RepID=A0A9Q0JBS1_9ROSI|nr:hypothetical protein Tsubulata_048076 [Turnera subulata]
MGGEEALSSGDKFGGKESNQKKRLHSEKPPFTLAMLKKAIPPHCFERSLLRSLFDISCDIAICSTLFYAAKTIIPILPHPLQYVAWPTYWVVQGIYMSGLWGLGHELGHNGFSDYAWVDNLIGFVLHSALMTPYFSWKYSHRRHHSNTASLHYDEVYPPPLKDSLPWYARYLENPVCRAIGTVGMLFTAFPLYFLVNAYSRKYDSFANHFYPYSPIFNDSERLQVVISDAGILAALYVCYSVAKAYGFAWLFCIYLGPLLIMFAMVISITYLQHTNPTLPHYDDSEWEWLRGGLCTIDLDLGPWINSVFHQTVVTHLCHHLFPTIPHYHALEATEAIKPILGDYYQRDSTPFLKMLDRAARECVYAEPEEDPNNKGVYWWKPYKHKI